MRNITLEDFINYKGLTDLSLSPDKKQISFIVSSPDKEKNIYDNSLFFCDTNDNSYKEIVSMGSLKVNTWLNNDTILYACEAEEKIPNEEWTVFNSLSLNSGESSEYFRIPYNITKLKCIDSSHAAALVRYDYNKSGLSELSPDEKTAKLLEIENAKAWDIYDEIPFWLNSKGKMNKVRSRLFMIDMKAGKAEAISKDYANVEQFIEYKNTILFIANDYESKKLPYNGLFSYNLDTELTDCLVEQGHYDIQYANYIDDKLVFIGSDMKLFGVNENPTFYTIENGKIKELYNYDLSAKSSVATDCRFGDGIQYQVYDNCMYFLSTVDYYTEICKYSFKANCVQCVYGDKSKGSIDNFAICDNGIYFIGLQDNSPQEVYRVNENNHAAVTDLNKHALIDCKVSAPEEVSLNNGVDLTGFVLKPIDYDPTKKYPAILAIHGGPKASFGKVFSHETQLWASRGYFTMFTNPRGSDGRGNDFADIVGKQGTVDMDDLMKFVDKVLEEYPAIDGNRLGVTGSSYGGYMTNWLIGHTNRFKAAVAQCSIANWISKVMTTDIGYSFNTTQLGATPWNNAEKMWFHSPMKYADKAKTPTLFIHGDEDYRCWLSEPLQMFMSLRYHNVDSKVVVFHGEHHGLSKGKISNRIKRHNEILDWFDKYLKL